jgi:hypothetical protein
MKKITLYSVLGTLKDNGLIEQNGDVYSEQTIAATASD